MFEFLQNNWLLSPWAWALLCGAAALWCLIPRGRFERWQIALGGVLGVVSVGLFASQVPVLMPWTDAALFWLVAAVTVVSAAAMISMRSPVYCAIWFAMTLLGTSGLFLLQGAQLLAVATIVVYAGAIVVMFLFLIMLAQPEGQEYYDRISWNSSAALVSSIAGAAMVLLLTTAIVNVGDSSAQLRQDIAARLPEIVEDGERNWHAGDIHAVRLNRNQADDPVLTLTLKQPASDELSEQAELAALRNVVAVLPQLQGTDAEGESIRPAEHQIVIEFVDDHGTIAEQHVATLGGVLFSKYLIAVEVAGTLLLIALVGAVSIIMHGREQEASQVADAGPPSAGGDA